MSPTEGHGSIKVPPTSKVTAWTRLWLRIDIEVQRVGQESQLVGRFLNLLGRGLASPVTGSRLNSNEHGLIARLAFLQSGGEFEAVSRHDPIIVIGCGYQGCRIFRARLELVQGRVTIEGFEIFRIVSRAVIGSPG